MTNPATAIERWQLAAELAYDPDIRTLNKTILLFVVYVLTARAGLSLGAVSGFATLVWPATGIAFAALYLLGLKLWPGVALGAFVVNLWVGAPVAAALGIAFGNSLEAVAGAWLFRRALMGSTSRLERTRDVSLFLFRVVLLSTLASATIGVLSLSAAGLIGAGQLLTTWRAWWTGDAISDLILAPFVLAWSRPFGSRLTVRRVLEAIAVTILVAGASLLIFGRWMQWNPLHLHPYLLFPLLIWTTLRFGPRASTGFAIVVSAIAIWATYNDYGPFRSDDLAERLFELQIFMSTVAITGLFFGAQGREREAALDARTEFISVASHELLTPLTSMRLYVEMAERSLDSGEPHRDLGRVRKMVVNCQKQVDRLIYLVEELLDMSRIQKGRLLIRKEDMDLAELVSDVVENLRRQIEAAGCSLVMELQSPLVGRWDRRRLEQVVINFLTNAMKFGSQGKVELSLRRNEAGIVLSVRDFGRGIAKEDQIRIFEPFERTQDARSIGGLGLGLHICKQIVEGHQGTIRVESELGKGATFVVELPMA